MTDNAPERIWAKPVQITVACDGEWWSPHPDCLDELPIGATEYLRADVATARIEAQAALIAERIEALSGLILDLAELVEDCLEDGGEFSTEWDIKARDSLARAKELSI